MSSEIVEALKRELAGYELRGKSERAEQVRAELRRLRGDAKAEVETTSVDVAVEAAVKPSPRGRRGV